MLHKSLFLLLLYVTMAFAYEAGIRLAWDFNTLRKIYGGSSYYPRLIRLKNGDLLCAFENWAYRNGKIVVSVLVTRSTDDGQTWQSPVEVVHSEDDVKPSVPDLLQLSNGYVLLAYNPRPPKNNIDPQKHFAIKTAISMDNGHHWMHWSDVYTASYLFSEGCWEPAAIQLPSGEVQLYIANEFPYTQSAEQEITMFRSFNYGYSWNDTLTVSFRAGSRDGMPVPLLLRSGLGIAVAIEDNGWGDNQFKPTIVWSSLEDNWRSAPVGGDSPFRWRALKSAYRIPDGEVGAAPFIVQLPSGEVILSYQGTEGQHPNSNPDAGHVAMFTAIGNEKARNFSRKSKPFKISDDKTAMWNSLCVKNDSTITAVTSTTNFSADGTSEIFAIDGHVLHEPSLRFVPSITLDGLLNESEWKGRRTVFIGAYSSTQVRIKMLWNREDLFIGGSCSDRFLWADNEDDAADDDGLNVYFDISNKNSMAPQSGIYKLTADINGDVELLEGNASGQWQKIEHSDIHAVFFLQGHPNDSAPDSGYTFEIKIPWKQIGGRPPVNRKWGISFALRDDADGGAIELQENLSGDEPQKPFTYFAAQLGDSLTGLTHPKIETGARSFILEKNYPNPFNSDTIIKFSVRQANHISLDIINAAGQKIQTLINSFLRKGSYNQLWDGCDYSRHRVSSGIYFCRLKVGRRQEVKKMVLLR